MKQSSRVDRRQKDNDASSFNRHRGKERKEVDVHFVILNE